MHARRIFVVFFCFLFDFYCTYEYSFYLFFSITIRYHDITTVCYNKKISALKFFYVVAANACIIINSRFTVSARFNYNNICTSLYVYQYLRHSRTYNDFQASFDRRALSCDNKYRTMRARVYYSAISETFKSAANVGRRIVYHSRRFSRSNGNHKTYCNCAGTRCYDFNIYCAPHANQFKRYHFGNPAGIEN